MAETAELIKKDTSHLWHPFTQMKLWPQEPPLIIDSAEGNWLIDSQGKRYFDGVSSLWVTVHGHNHPVIKKAIQEQLEKLDHSTLLGLSHPNAAELAEVLARISGLDWAFYSESGSTAVEIGLKIAFQYWQQSGHPEKKTFVALENAYHGDTLGSVSVGGMELFHEIYGPLLFPVHRLPQPHCRLCRLGLKHPDCGLACAEALDTILNEHGHEICGLIIEPRIQGAAGMIVQPEGYLKRVYDICKKHDVLFIADEVATGFGRTGKLFACELEDTPPDIMTMGKGITGGTLPLAATMVSDRIYQAFLGDYTDFKTFFHGHTYTGNPLACAAALASIGLMESENTVKKAGPMIEQLSNGLKEIGRMPHVLEIRQQGVMVGIELGLDKESGAAYPVEQRMGHQVIMAAREHGVIIRPLGDTVVLMPPLSSSPEEIELLLSTTKKAIALVTEADS